VHEYFLRMAGVDNASLFKTSIDLVGISEKNRP